MSQELRQRILSGIVMAVVFISGVLIGGGLFAFMIGLIAAVIWHEWFEMNLPNGDDRGKLLGFLALCSITFALILLSGTSLLLALIGIFAVTCGVFLSWDGAKDCVSGIIYAGGFLVAMVMLRGEMSFAPGLFAILYLCAVIWMTDIGAYFAGRFFGGPKLAPMISPNKTISGAIGGMLIGCSGAIVVASIAGNSAIFTLAVLALAMSAISQAGDLFESYLKRSAGVKDSGTFIPGHGGAMDRVDGLVFAAIFLWLVCSAQGFWSAPALALFI